MLHLETSSQFGPWENTNIGYFRCQSKFTLMVIIFHSFVSPFEHEKSLEMVSFEETYEPECVRETKWGIRQNEISLFLFFCLQDLYIQVLCCRGALRPSK